MKITSKNQKKINENTTLLDLILAQLKKQAKEREITAQEIIDAC